MKEWLRTSTLCPFSHEAELALSPLPSIYIKTLLLLKDELFLPPPLVFIIKTVVEATIMSYLDSWKHFFVFPTLAVLFLWSAPMIHIGATEIFYKQILSVQVSRCT